MMIVIVRQDVAAGAERAPTDAGLVQLVNDRGRLFFSVRRDYPIDRAADAQTRQLRKALATLRAHSQSRRDFCERPVALLQLVYLFSHLHLLLLRVSVPLWFKKKTTEAQRHRAFKLTSLAFVHVIKITTARSLGSRFLRPTSTR